DVATQDRHSFPTRRSSDLVQMRKALTGRVLTELENLAEKTPDDFAKIWEAFGSVLKEGIYEDFERRDQLLALSRFTTTVDGSVRSEEHTSELQSLAYLVCR